MTSSKKHGKTKEHDPRKVSDRSISSPQNSEGEKRTYDFLSDICNGEFDISNPPISNIEVAMLSRDQREHINPQCVVCHRFICEKEQYWQSSGISPPHFSPLCEKCGYVGEIPKGAVDLCYPQSSNESQDGPSLLFPRLASEMEQIRRLSMDSKMHFSLACQEYENGDYRSTYRVDLHGSRRSNEAKGGPSLLLVWLGIILSDLFHTWIRLQNIFFTIFFIFEIMMRECSMVALCIVLGWCGCITSSIAMLPAMFALLWSSIHPFRVMWEHQFLWGKSLVMLLNMGYAIATPSKNEAYPCDANPTTIISGAAWSRWEPPSLYEAFLSEKWCRLWIDSSPSSPTVSRPEQEVKETLLEEVDVNPALQAATKQAIRLALQGAAISNFPGNITDTKVEIELRVGYSPVSSAPRALGPAQTKLLKAWITEQVALGMYEQASPGCLWASCLHIAPTWKSVDSPSGPTPKLEKIRVCGDYRAVNEQLVKVAQVVPLISDIKQKLAGFRCYARFDMAAGFNAISLEEGSRDVLAIRTPLGLFRPTRMPFGPKNNPSKYQKIVESLVNHLVGYGSNICVYIDDILIGAQNENELTQMVQDVLASVTIRGGIPKPKKIRIGYPSEVTLGSEISREGIRPSAAHVASVQAIRLPCNPSEMRSVIGLFTYFFEHFALGSVSEWLLCIAIPEMVVCFQTHFQAMSHLRSKSSKMI